MSFFNLLRSKPLGPLRGSNQGARRSQKRIVSPPKIISPVGERIRYLPKPVGPWADPTLAPRRWSLTKKVNA
uniref:ORF71b n=1 Tax=Pinus koraiensis TaxID=88728 RepID=A4QM99_PINKO|nr:ORF71b [Pinus koraiensis]ABP35436.1 ORF71b [Pinus koraiensis]